MAAKRAFEAIKDRLCSASSLSLPNLSSFFSVECDVSRARFGMVIIQAKHPLAFFSEKLNGSGLNYSTYDKEFYAIVRPLEYWNHYLNTKPVVLHLDRKPLSYINGQQKLNTIHANWVEFL